jgi:putative aldouronate transport system permease protein
MKTRETPAERIFYLFIMLYITVAMFLSAYPIIYSISASISDPDMVNTGKVFLWPVGFTLKGYETVFNYNTVMIGYRNTIFYTICGTFINVSITLMTAYALSRKDLFGRGPITAVFAFTMWFSGGLIPTYIIVNKLALVNTPLVMLVVSAISMWNTLITRAYMQHSIPYEIQESAIIDGCTDFTIFFRMILPLSAPVIAVITLYYAVEHWNSYFNALIYLTDRNLQPLQIVLREILIQNQTINMQTTEDIFNIVERARLAQTMKYSLIVVASVPMLLLYPFIQKYFVKGIMVGAIKG